MGILRHTIFVCSVFHTNYTASLLLLFFNFSVEYSVKFMIKNYDCKRINQNKEENLKLRAEIECAVLDLYSNAEGDHKIKVVSFE